MNEVMRAKFPQLPGAQQVRKCFHYFPVTFERHTEAG